MKLILHIGQSKTGTTALQSFLFSNKAQLLEKNILYPDYRISNMALNTPEHNSFAEQLYGMSRHPHLALEEYFEQFRQEMQDTACDTMILSAESFFGAPQIWRLKETQDFWSAHEEKLNALKQFTGDFETEIIGYFNPPEAWFETSASHAIRYAGLFGKNVYENDEQFFDLLKPHMDYPKLLDLWNDIIQPQKMTIRPYEREKLVQRDIIQDFCAYASIDTHSFNFKTKKHQKHSSLDRRYLEVKKQLNKNKRTKAQERIIIECLDRLNAQLPNIEKYKIDPKLKQRIKDHSRPCHEWMTKNYSQKDEPFFKINKPDSETQTAITEEDLNNAMKEFESLYSSWPIKWLHFKIKTKSLLRNRHPRLYAALKNIVSR